MRSLPAGHQSAPQEMGLLPVAPPSGDSDDARTHAQESQRRRVRNDRKARVGRRSHDEDPYPDESREQQAFLHRTVSSVSKSRSVTAVCRVVSQNTEKALESCNRNATRGQLGISKGWERLRESSLRSVNSSD